MTSLKGIIALTALTETLHDMLGSVPSCSLTNSH